MGRLMQGPVDRKFMLELSGVCVAACVLMNIFILSRMKPPLSQEGSNFVSWARTEIGIMRGQLDVLLAERK